MSLTAMRPIWPLALDCLTTKHERILISYKFFHINIHVLADTTKHENGMMPPPAGDGFGPGPSAAHWHPAGLKRRNCGQICPQTACAS